MVKSYTSRWTLEVACVTCGIEERGSVEIWEILVLHVQGRSPNYVLAGIAGGD